MKSLLLLVGALAGLGLFVPRVDARPVVVQDYDLKVSPFDGLRWSGDRPEVDVAGTWYRPLEINGVTVDSILEFCDGRWRGQRKKRFGEDLAEALVLMGHDIGKTAKLKLERISDDEVVTFDSVAMTKAKRRAIRDASSKREARPPRVTTISAEDAQDDVAAFGDGLRSQFAYFRTKGVDVNAELEVLAEGMGEEVDVAVFAQDLNRILYLFGDGHAGVRGADGPAGLHIPFLMAPAKGGVVAFDSGRDGFIDPKRPYVQSIDGTDIADWVDGMRSLVVDGSPQLIEHRALRAMRELERVRKALGREASGSVSVTISSKAKGGSKKSVELPLVERRPTYGPWPRSETRLLEGRDAAGAKGGIGVIRLLQMDDDLIPALRSAMDDFKDTDGLIVDVRGNGGGRRGLLAALGGYLVDESTGPVVGNCAAYRRAPQFKDDHLGGSRLLYRAGDPRWSPGQQKAIEAFARDFQPEWELPDGFSEWHYLVLDRTGEPGEYFYTSPVVVLVDEGCFSATDIFAAAMGALPNVTLMGTATGGGSARTQSFRLPKSGLEVRCASMASFQPNGQLYDGNGVQVDIEVEREPEDLLQGDSDHQLEAAVKWLAKQR